MKKLFLILSTVLVHPFTALANGAGHWNMNGWGHMMGFGYGGILMWIIFLIIIGVIIYLVLRGTKSSNPFGSDSSSGETPLDILKKRYAKGEITREEFEGMKRDLFHDSV
jgi:putative membrane protein